MKNVTLPAQSEHLVKGPSMSDPIPARAATALAERVRTLKLDDAALERRRAGAGWPVWLLVLAALAGVGYVGFNQWQLGQTLTERIDKQIADLKETLAEKNGTGFSSGG